MRTENYLQQIMSEKKLSYRQLAKLSGVSFSALQKIANGERSPTQRTMIAIARALDLRVEEVFILETKERR